MFDSNGYPTDASLKVVERWIGHFGELFDYIKDLWNMDYGDWTDEEINEDGVVTRRLTLITGGWSGNESVIGAMEDNFVFSNLCWFSSERGGKHVYELVTRDDHEE